MYFIKKIRFVTIVPTAAVTALTMGWLFGCLIGCNESGLSFGFPEATNSAASTREVTITIAASSGTASLTRAPFGTGTIEVGLGTQVTWVNNDSRSHSIVSNNGDWSVGTLVPGQSLSRVFNNLGTFTYGCRIHPEEQTGSIRVVSVPAAFPSASPFPFGSPAPPLISPF